MNIFDLGNFNRVKVYIDVPYEKRKEAKRWKCRWDSNEKLWYFIHNEGYKFKNITGTMKFLLIFDIIKIKHNFYDEHTQEHKDIVNFFKAEKQAVAIKIIECDCGSKYKLIEEEEHFLTEKHQQYIKEQEEISDCGF